MKEEPTHKKYIQDNTRQGRYKTYYRFKKVFYGLPDIPTIFPEKKDRTLNYERTV